MILLTSAMTLSAVTIMVALLPRCALHNIQFFKIQTHAEKVTGEFSVVFEVAAIV